MSSVPKSKRGKTELEADRHLYALRDEITELTILDFGFSEKKYEEKIEKFRKAHEHSEQCEEIVARRRKKLENFKERFIDKEADVVLNMLRKIQTEYSTANSIYPSDTPARLKEYIQRRLHMNLAISGCEVLIQELQYIGRVLPVDFNHYENLTDKIEVQKALFRGMRKADNRFLKKKQGTL